MAVYTYTPLISRWPYTLYIPNVCNHGYRYGMLTGEIGNAVVWGFISSMTGIVFTHTGDE